MGKALDIGSILVALKAAEVTNDVSGRVGYDVRTVEGMVSGGVREDLDGIRTDAIAFVQGLDTKEQGILRRIVLVTPAQGDGLGSLGDDVLDGCVKQRDEGAVATQFQGTKLGQRGEVGARGQGGRYGLVSAEFDRVSRDLGGHEISEGQ